MKHEQEDLRLNNSPLVSVIVPVRNGSPYIQSALDSIVAQAYPSLEMIIVDDGSEDSTAQIVSDSPLEPLLIRHAQVRGVAAARNTGVKRATAEFIAFLDADDMWPPQHLKKRIASLMNDQRIMGSRGATASFRVRHDGTTESIAQSFVPFHLGASVFRAQLFKAVGMFDESLILGSDADFYFRCQRANVTFLEDSNVSLYYRKSSESLSRDARDPKRMLRGLAQVLNTRLLRERAA